MTHAKSKTLRRNILKLIRSKQQDEYKQMFTPVVVAPMASATPPAPPNTNPTETAFTNDFKKSFEYLTHLAKKEEISSSSQNQNSYPATRPPPPSPPQHTLKHTSHYLPAPSAAPSLSTPSSVAQSNIPVAPPAPVSTHMSTFTPRPIPMHTVLPTPSSSVYPNLSPHPGYGCMKNGSYPTFRTWKHHHQSSNPVPSYVPQPMETPYSAPQFTSVRPPSTPPLHHSQGIGGMGAAAGTPQRSENTEIRKKEEDLVMTPKKTAATILMQQIQQTKQSGFPSSSSSSLSSKPKPYDQKYRIRNRYRRKLYKRTFRVGKSNIERKVGCLISNKTIRQNIQQKCYELKKTDMKEVRKYLLKHGLIKVGTTAPNDVLRKMYESITSICGEIENHNPDILLHNFVNEHSEKF